MLKVMLAWTNKLQMLNKQKKKKKHNWCGVEDEQIWKVERNQNF